MILGLTWSVKQLSDSVSPKHPQGLFMWKINKWLKGEFEVTSELKVSEDKGSENWLNTTLKAQFQKDLE